jgi:hypothetical protein
MAKGLAQQSKRLVPVDVKIEDIQRKYKDWNIIEVTAVDYVKMQDLFKTTEDILLPNKNFPQFLPRAVVVLKSSDGSLYYYVYEFINEYKINSSVVIADMITGDLKTVMKVSTHYSEEHKMFTSAVIEYTNVDLMEAHYDIMKLENPANVKELVEEQRKKQHPTAEKKPDIKLYYEYVINEQVGITVRVNSFLARNHKIKLYSRIEQKRLPQASSTPSKRTKANPFYRYVVELPKNYKPRPVDLNWQVAEWERSGHVATRWVRKENAEILAKRKGGKVVPGVTRRGLQKIEIPIKHQHCHRKKGNPVKTTEQKIYST